MAVPVDRDDGTRKHAGGVAFFDELLEVDSHGSDITRDKNPTSIGSHTQNLGIGNTVGNCLGSMPKIERVFPASQSPPDVGIEIGISLKTDPQAGLSRPSFLP